MERPMTNSIPALLIEMPFLRAFRPLLESVAQLALRFSLAIPFYRSGLTKWNGFLNLSDSADALFTDEFKLHILGGQYPFPAPHQMAFASGVMEVLLPILLVLGLGTRLAALGLLGMTAVIQLTEPDGWASFHLIWAATAIAIFLYGPGRISLDALAVKLLMGRNTIGP
jgi:putative oxidoreductase